MNRVLRLATVLLLLTTPLLAQTAQSPRSSVWSESVFASFGGYNGGGFAGDLMQASDGNFYGTVAYYGPNNAGQVFQVTPAGVINTFYAFCSQASCADGKQPNLDLVQGPDGALYGTTTLGGNANSQGVVFRLTLAGQYSVIHTFCSAAQCSDGSGPNAGLTINANGGFYGTTAAGGTGTSGTIFSITPTGTLTTLYAFCSQTRCSDGGGPNGQLIQGIDGTLYGTTVSGGANNLGTLFGFNPGGTKFTTFESFCDDTCTAGWQPNNGLAIGNDGNVYGTTMNDGPNSDRGVAYELNTTTSVYKLLYTFCNQASCIDGNSPRGGLTQATDGLLYGTTIGGGNSSQYGVAYSVNSSNSENVIYDFLDGSDGALPVTTMIQASDGALYGATTNGGANGAGAIFKLSNNLAKPLTLTSNSSAIQVGSSFTLSWSVANAASMTMRQCYASVLGNAAGAGSTWQGKLSGTPGSASLSGSVTVKPTTNAVYTYAITCGGKISALTTVNATNGTKANTATTLAITPASPLVQGQTATLTATVSRELATGNPGGSVTFYYGTLAIGSATVNSSGVATYAVSTSSVAPGTYALTANYQGDSNDSPSISAPQTVQLLGNTHLVITASPNPATPPATVKLTATVQAFSGTATGTVTFSVPHVATLGTAPLVNGVATYSTSTTGVPPGTYQVQAQYNGATGYDQTTGTVTVTLQ